LPASEFQHLVEPDPVLHDIKVRRLISIGRPGLVGVGST
jgi:hypothetical protein